MHAHGRLNQHYLLSVTKIRLPLTITFVIRLNEDCGASEALILCIDLPHCHLCSVPLLNCNDCFPCRYKLLSGLIATNRCLYSADRFSHGQEISTCDCCTICRLYLNNSSKPACKLLRTNHAESRLQSDDCTTGHVICKVSFLHQAISTVVTLNLQGSCSQSLFLHQHFSNTLSRYETTQMRL